MNGMGEIKMSYLTKVSVTLETEVRADGLGFANQCVEAARSLQSLLHGGVSIKMFRVNAESKISPSNTHDAL